MAENKIEFRDGLNQNNRKLTALDADYISVEERSTVDLLKYAKNFLSSIKFNFLGQFSDSELNEMVDFLENPEKFKSDEKKLQKYSKPHITLFLVFLKLLEHPQKQFADLTKRHLDYYYRKVLMLEEKAEIPDKVNVMFELTNGVDSYLLKKGTLLNAGQDSYGAALNYSIDKDFVLNNAKIASIKRTYAKKINIFRQIYRKYLVDKNSDALFGAVKATLHLTTLDDATTRNVNALKEIEDENNAELVDIINSLQQVYKDNVLADIKKRYNFSKHSQDDFISLLKFVIDDPLPAMPLNIKNIDELLENLQSPLLNTKNKELILDYIENQLYLSIDDFYEVMKIDKLFKDEKMFDTEQTRTELDVQFYPPLLNSYLIKKNELEKTERIFSEDIFDSNLSNIITPFTPFDSKRKYPESQNLGFAIVSPILYLKEGNRIITFKFSFNNDISKCDVYLTTALGWKKCESKKFNVNDSTFVITLDTDFPEVTVSDKIEFNAQYPVVKFLFKDIDYDSFKSINVNSINIQVKVTGLKNLSMRNDAYLIDNKNPFKLFGDFPKIGSGFYFSSQELCEKKLDSLTLNFNWIKDNISGKDIPEMSSRYNIKGSEKFLSYFATNDDFKTNLRFFYNNTSIVLADNSKLFDKALVYSNPQLPTSSTNKVYTEDIFSCPKYFKLELNGRDFMQDIYPTVVIQRAQASENVTVYPPYIPELESISFEYTASINISSNDTQPLFFHIYPFGIKNMNMNNSLLPKYTREGYLYIGIKDINPGENISFLFQIADYNLEKVTNLSWSYLSDDNWLSINSMDILKQDTTNGLKNSGIVSICLPENATNTNFSMPANLYWIRIMAIFQADLIPDIIDIRTNVVQATFVNMNNDTYRLTSPLLENSITGLVKRDSNIKALFQPYPSFNGRAKESEDKFYIRSSETLRHRKRAITRLDYEHLILEEFPEIYKVKCISAYEMSLYKEKDSTQNIGEIRIIVIPYPSERQASYPPKLPRASIDLLNRIQKYIEDKVSPFVKVTVKNPTYEQISLRLNVKFKDECIDYDYYCNELKKGISKFVCPWAYGTVSDIAFGTSLHQSLFINYIENLSYIDHIRNFEFTKQQIINADGTISKNISTLEDDSLFARWPDSILVTSTEIVVEYMDIRYFNFKGIGYMKINVDFKIQPSSFQPTPTPILNRGIGYGIIGTDFKIE